MDWMPHPESHHAGMYVYPGGGGHGGGVPTPTPAGLGSPLSQEEIDSYLNQEKPSAQYGGWLKWISDALGKTGRSARAIVGGLSGMNVAPSEYFGSVPFSDTLGLTKQENAITGSKLNRQWGLTHDDSFWGDLGTDVLTDPLTYLTLGGSALAKAGVTSGAKVAGRALAPSLATRAYQGLSHVPLVGGRFAAKAEAGVADALARAGKTGTTVVGTAARPDTLTDVGRFLSRQNLLPERNTPTLWSDLFGGGPASKMGGYRSLETLPGSLTETVGGTLAPKLSLGATQAERDIIQSLFEGAQSGRGVAAEAAGKIGIPFTGIGFNVGGSTPTRLATEALSFPFGSTGRMGDLWRTAGHNIPGNTRFRQLFSGERGDQPSAIGQEMFRSELAPTQKRLEQQYSQTPIALMQDLKAAQLPGKGSIEDRMAMRDIAEQYPPKIPGSWTPQMRTGVENAFGKTRQSLEEMYKASEGLGIAPQRMGAPMPPGQMGPPQPDHWFPRSAENTVVEGAGGTRRGAIHEMARDIPFSGRVYDKLVGDPVVAGLKRTAPTDEAAVRHLIEQYGSGGLAGNWAKEWNLRPDWQKQYPSLGANFPTPAGLPGGIDTLGDAIGMALHARQAGPSQARGVFTHPVEGAADYAKRAAAEQALATTKYNQAAHRSFTYDEARAAGLNTENTVNILHVLDDIAPPAGKEVGAMLPGAAEMAAKNRAAAEQHMAGVLSTRYGRDILPEELKNFVMTPESYQAIDQLGRTQGKLIDALVAGIDKVPFLDSYNNLYKVYQTVPWPRHLFQKMLGGGINNLITGTANPHGYWANKKFWAGEVIPGLAQAEGMAGKFATDEEATQYLARLMSASGSMKKLGPQTADVTGAVAEKGLQDLYAVPGVQSAKQIFSGSAPWFPMGKEATLAEKLAPYNPLAMRGVGDNATTAFAPMRAMEGILEGIDKSHRTAHVINRIFQGVSPEGALASMMNTHLDYGSMSKFEREVMRRLLPFYSFSRLNAANMADQIMTYPGRVGVAVKAMQKMQQPEEGTGLDNYIPEYLRGSSVFRSGQAQEGVDPVSGRPMTSQIFGQLPATPLEEAMRLIKPGPQWDRRAMDDVISNANPLLRWGYQAATGKNPLTGQEQSMSLDPKWWEDPDTKALREIAQFTPAARAVQTGVRLNRELGHDSHMSPTQAWMGEALGMPAYKEVELRQAKMKDELRALSDKIQGNTLPVRMLGGSEGVPEVQQSGGKFFVPEESQWRVRGTPNEQLMRAYATLEERKTLDSMYRKVENAEKAKEELATLMRTPGADRTRINTLNEVASLQPLWELAAREKELGQQLRTGIPGHEPHNPLAAPLAKMFKYFRLGGHPSFQE